MKDEASAALGRIKAALDYKHRHVQLTEAQAREVLAHIAALEARAEWAEAFGHVFHTLSDGRLDFVAVREGSPLGELHRRAGAAEARAKEAEAQAERLQKIIDGCDWFWPADDTSEDLCADCWQEAMAHGAYGEVWEVARGGIVERMWCAVLPPAPDAETDDDFEICEDTAEAAEAKLAAEIERRARIAEAEGRD